MARLMTTDITSDRSYAILSIRAPLLDPGDPRMFQSSGFGDEADGQPIDG
jgi:hypothetical protein